VLPQDHAHRAVRLAQAGRPAAQRAAGAAHGDGQPPADGPHARFEPLLRLEERRAAPPGGGGACRQAGRRAEASTLHPAQEARLGCVEDPLREVELPGHVQRRHSARLRAEVHQRRHARAVLVLYADAQRAGQHHDRAGAAARPGGPALNPARVRAVAVLPGTGPGVSVGPLIARASRAPKRVPQCAGQNHVVASEVAVESPLLPSGSGTAYRSLQAVLSRHVLVRGGNTVPNEVTGLHSTCILPSFPVQ
jgi:hypothetical protein